MWKNSLYNTIGGVLKLILGILSVPILTKTLGLNTYGLYTSTNAILNIALFAEWSIAASITVFLSKEISLVSTQLITKKKYNTFSVAAIFVLSLCVITAIVLGLSVTRIALLFDNLPANQRELLKKAVQMSIGIIVARLIHQFFLGILQANSKYGILNSVSTIYSIISVTVTLLLATLTGDIILIQLCQAILAICMIGVYYISCQKSGLFSIHYFTKPTLLSIREFSTYGMRIWVLAIGTTLFSQGDRLLVLRLFGAELSGIYSAITALCSQINIISAMPVQPILPRMSEYYEKRMNGLSEHMNSLFIKSFIVSTCIIIPAGAGLICFSSQIIQFLFSDSLIDHVTLRLLLVITALAYTLYSFNAVGYFTLLATKNESYTTKVVVISGVFSLFFIYYLATHFGLIGACLGNFGYSISLLLNIKAAKQIGMARLSLGRKIIITVCIGFLLSLISFYTNNLLLNGFLYGILLLWIVFFIRKNTSIKYYFI